MLERRVIESVTIVEKSTVSAVPNLNNTNM